MNRKKSVDQKITALYCRISLDDGGDNESMSISNQKIMLREFAEKNGLFQHEYYVDDGYTGRNFNRPSFQRLIADIEAGRVGCVITKDLSRLGRNWGGQPDPTGNGHHTFQKYPERYVQQRYFQKGAGSAHDPIPPGKVWRRADPYGTEA